MKDYDQAVEQGEELSILNDFLDAGEASEEEVEQAYDRLVQMVEKLEFRNMMRNEEDSLNAVITINAGAGG